MAAQAPVEQPAAYAEGDANNVSDPVAHVCTAIKRGLYELDEAAEGAGTYKHNNQPQAARAGQWEGQCGEGNEVHELVTALGCGRRGVERPEHGNCQGDCHNGCERDVEVLAHGVRVQCRRPKAKRGLRSGILNGFSSRVSGAIRIRVRAGDLQALAFDFPNYMRCNICYTPW